ncbi:MAG: hypothetical protein AAFU85_01050 [Planctomycetota bacterium]
MRHTRIIKSLCATITALGLVYLTTSLLGTQRVEADATVSPPDTPQTLDDSLVVHEWGTFTTFSGSDGVYLDYRPLASDHSDLPTFVLDRLSTTEGLPVFVKKRVKARVRMETPVTYFYTDEPRSVNVRVDFPKGMLTEYYPPVKEMQPPLDRKAAFGEGELIGDSSLDWGTIDLIPTDSIISSSIDEPLRSRLAEAFTSRVLPQGGAMQHYGHARDTDSALVYVRQERDEKSFNFWNQAPPSAHFEKFLFYRGVGKFELPVAVQYDADSPRFINRGQDSIRSIILLEVRDGKMRMNVVDEVASGSSQTFSDLRPVSEQGLADTLIQRLVAEGLYEKEARSMVNTWKSSWFTEEGRRVLYMVPGKITEELLPLHVEPAPNEMLRVLVGRMELMSPGDEQALLTQVRESVDQRALHRGNPESAKQPYAIPAGIASYGRMAEPALARIATIAKEQTVRREARWLIARLQQD